MEDEVDLNKSYFDKNDKYLPTDSDDDYSEEEQEILKEVRKGRHRQKDAKQEVLRFEDSDDEEEEEEDDVRQLMADSDIEGAEDGDDDMPDPMNWGRNKRNYYHTDFVDPDYSSYTAKEEELAKMEEEEAMLIQKRLIDHMREEDFFLDEDISKDDEAKKSQKVADDSQDVTKIEARFDSMSEKERLKLFAQDSPEFDGLVNDMQTYLAEVAEVTIPVLEYVKANNVPMIPALEYAKLYQDAVLHYNYNVLFYLRLKANRVNIRNHKIVKHLLTLKNVLTQLQEKYENFIKPQLEDMLERIQSGEEFEVEEVKPELAANKKKSKLSIMDEFDGEAKQHKKTATSIGQLEASSSTDEDEEEEEAGDEELSEDNEEDARRGITYQIAKNKGLMPQRKKEARNPRVKHRNKFRKALVRRKGAVRSVRKEIKRYGGEISGINVRNVKSVKIK